MGYQLVSTPRDLMADTWTRCKELVFLKGNLEDYVLFTVAKLSSFGVGLGIGYWLWGMS